MMRSVQYLAMAVLLASGSVAASAQHDQTAHNEFSPTAEADDAANDESRPVVGEIWLMESRQNQVMRSDTSSRTQSGSYSFTERVVAVAADSITYEYDLPPGSSADLRSRVWQFPVQVLRPTSGPARLVDPAALERRIDAWLAALTLTRADCGRMVFTWTAGQIDCDPQTVIATLDSVILPREAATLGLISTHPLALGPGVFVRSTDGALRSTLIVDPEIVRQQRATTDVEVAQLIGTPITPAEAAERWSRAVISGTITITLHNDPVTGRPARRETETKIIMVETEDGSDQTLTTDVATRTPVPPGN